MTRRLGTQCARAVSSAHEAAWRRLVARLPRIHREFLQWATRNALDPRLILYPQTKPNLNPGRVLWHRKRKYRIKAIVGVGSEGCIYLVDTDHGERVIKQFYDERSLRRNLRLLSEWLDAQVPFPKFDSVSYKTRTVMMEYWPSINVEYLFRCAGISRAEYAALRQKMGVLHAKHKQVHFRNTVVTVPTGELRPIEPC